MHVAVVTPQPRRPQPAVPVQSGRRIAVRDDRAGIAADDTGKHPIHVHVQHFAQAAARDVIPRRNGVRRAAVLKPGLNDPLVLAGRFDHLAAFPDRQRDVLLDIHVLAGLAGPNSRQRVPLFGRGDDNALHLLVVQNRAEINHVPACRGLQFGQFSHGRFSAGILDVAHVLDLDVRHLDHFADHVHPSPAGAHQGHDYPVGWRPGERGRGSERHGGERKEVPVRTDVPTKSRRFRVVAMFLLPIGQR